MQSSRVDALALGLNGATAFAPTEAPLREALPAEPFPVAIDLARISRIERKVMGYVPLALVVAGTAIYLLVSSTR